MSAPASPSPAGPFIRVSGLRTATEENENESTHRADVGHRRDERPLLAATAQAQQKSLKDRLVGAWTLNSIYDLLANGDKHDTWGPGVKGTVLMSASGRFSWQLVSANRDKSAAKSPRDPVAPAIGYFGSYVVDEAAKTVAFRIEGCTFPQWEGIERVATIDVLSDTEMSLKSAKVKDPTLGEFIPHSTWKRA